MAIQMRHAAQTDAEDAIDTLRRSISELCVADHQNDAQKIKVWLTNKTISTWNNWLTRHDSIVLVAVRNQSIFGVGMTTLQGKILLNYVHPDARFSGVSKAMLAAMEKELSVHCVHRAHVESTVTAWSFYANCGYRGEHASDLELSKEL